MNNDKEIISNYMNNLKRESDIDEPNADTAETKLNKNAREPDEAPAATPVSVSDQPYKPEPTVNYKSYIPDNNISVAQSMLNMLSGLTRCFNKYVQIPNYPAYAYIYFDGSYNAHLCTKDTNGQFAPFADILLEGSEFAVYQNCQRTGTLYGNDNEQI